MAEYKSVTITNAGLELIAATHSGGTIELTAIKTGNGVYDGTEVLEELTSLKSIKQTFGITGLTRESNIVKVRSVITNEGITEGYYITEIGLFAKDTTGNEILYAVIIAENGKADYLPPYEEFPQSITLEIYITTAGLEEGVKFIASIIEGTYVTVQDFEDYRITVENHLSNKSNPHEVTKSQVGLSNVPNVATNDQTPTYTEATSTTALTSGEKLSVAFGKIAKAVSSLISHLLNKSNPHEITKSQVGLSNVENKSSATIRGELTKENVTSALGYTPVSRAYGSYENSISLSRNALVILTTYGSGQIEIYLTAMTGGPHNMMYYTIKSAGTTTKVSGGGGSAVTFTNSNTDHMWTVFEF